MARAAMPLLLVLLQLAVAAARRDAVALANVLDVDEVVQAAEAANATAAAGGGGARGVACGYRVFTDVDDTMVCSEGAMFHGIDSNCDQKGTLYPGFAAFYWYVSVGKSECRTPAKVVPLSARPKELKAFFAIKPTDPANLKLVGVGQQQGHQDWGLDLDRALYGGVDTGMDVGNFKFEDSLSPNKWNGWKQWGSDLPTIFVGDNGQGDVYAAELMRDSATRGDGPPLVAAFIHHVQFTYPPTNPLLRSSVFSQRPGSRHALEPKGIFLFQTYAEAACLAFLANIIPAEGYTGVMNSILADCAPEGFRSQACKVTIPEFGIQGVGAQGQEQLYVRPAELCQRPRDISMAPQEFNSLALRLMWAGGLPSIGNCEDVNPELIQQMAAARRHVLGLPLPAIPAFDKGEFYMQNGVTTLVLHAVRHGFHCVSRCGYTCKHEQNDWRHAGLSLEGTGKHLDYSCADSLARNLKHALANLASGHRGRKVCRIQMDG